LVAALFAAVVVSASAANAKHSGGSVKNADIVKPVTAKIGSSGTTFHGNHGAWRGSRTNHTANNHGRRQQHASIASKQSKCGGGGGGGAVGVGGGASPSGPVSSKIHVAQLGGGHSSGGCH
jgi:hypothetical protein